MSNPSEIVVPSQNADAVTLTRGMILREGSSGALRAQANSLTGVSGQLGIMRSTQGAPSSQIVVGVGGAQRVLLVSGLTPARGQLVYVSAATAGRGTTVPPTIVAPIGIIISTARYAIDQTVECVLVPPGFAASATAREANWLPTQVRYFFVDGTNGNDANIGYIDAAAGTVFTPAQTSVVAIKTLGRLAEILPRYGNSLRAKVLIAAATYTDRLDIGQGGYAFLRFMGSDLTNSTTDNITLGTEIDPACVGPNADGSWTVSSKSNFRYTIAAGTLPAIGSLVGRRVVWAGNVTPAAASRTAFIINRNSATEFDAAASIALAVANGDQFTIRRPAVNFPGYVGAPVFTGTGGYGTYSGNGQDVGIPQLMGHYLTAAADYQDWPAGLLAMSTIRVAGGPVWGGYWNGVGSITFPSGFLDEAGAFRGDTTGLWLDANLYAATAGCGLFFGNVVNTNAAGYIEFFQMAAMAVLSGYFNTTVILSECGVPGNSASGVNRARIGNFVTAAIAPVVIETTGSVLSIASHMTLGKIASKKTTGDLFTAQGTNGSITLRDLSGTTGVVLNASAAESTRVTVDSGNTIVPATGGIRIAGNELVALADLAGISLTDRGNNVIQGITADITAVIYPSRTDDPAITPPVSHIMQWFREDTNQLSVKKSGGGVVRVTLT